ncbi:MAG: peptidoglycan DD-metalloendopeptidase family protein [Cyanobacteria bacterium P01_F01_bin.150]
MRRSTPDRYTVLIARTGGLPITLSINPGPVVLLMAIAAVSPMLWLGSRVSSLHRQNQELEDRNQALSQAADDVFKEIEELDSEISTLRERAGLTEAERAGVADDGPGASGSHQESSFLPRLRSQGGLNETLDAVDAFKAARAQLPSLISALNKQVKPALNETLAEEFAEADAKPSIRPVKASLEISSPFGIRRNPFGFGYEFHNGIDFAGPVGTPIYSTAPGKVKKAEWGKGYGYYVVIDHGYGYETLYAHLSKFKVDQGDAVDRSDVVGLLGNTGRSTGPHLHYSVYEDGEGVDPEDYLD